MTGHQQSLSVTPDWWEIKLQDGLARNGLMNLFDCFEPSFLPRDRLRIEHVRSHTGDPFNELVDWLAKKEGLSSLYLRRQPVNCLPFERF